MNSRLTFVILLAGNLLGGPPWKGKNPDPAHWTTSDIDHVLSSSPWGQQASAVFPEKKDDDEPASVYTLPGAAQAGMAGPRGGTDGHWSGGVAKNAGRGQLPTLTVLVRWDSALPIREALARSSGAALTAEPTQYEITVIGLVPAGKNQQLEGLKSRSMLHIPGRPPLAADHVEVDSDTGATHIFFSRANPIQSSSKEVLFTTRFGSLTVSHKFRLTEMNYRGRLEL